MHKPAFPGIPEDPGQLAAVQLGNVIIPMYTLAIPPAAADALGPGKPGNWRLGQRLRAF